MELNLHEWGDPGAPPVVCLHGISAHGRRFRKLAEERLAPRFHVLAPDLRGHGKSGHDPPWDIATHLDDVLETVGAGAATWLAHSFGGRLLVELAVRRPALLVYAREFGLARPEQVELYRRLPNLEVVSVPGGHLVYWDAFEETADAIDRFL